MLEYVYAILKHPKKAWISSYLHCIVQRLSKIGWNAPGTLDCKGKREQMQLFKYYLSPHLWWP